MKQVMFYDRENKAKLGGILTDDGDIICGDCGGIIPADEIGGEDDGFVILKEYENWTNLSETICGEDCALVSTDEKQEDKQ